MTHANIELAKEVSIEAVLAQRGYQLKRNGADLAGPCPFCGGRDRFVVTPKKRRWFCRGFRERDDVIGLVQRLDNVSFPNAVETLTGKRPEYESPGERAVRNIIERERRHREAQDNKHKAEQETAYALRWWNEGISIWETPAQAYLVSRCCNGLFPPDRDAVFRYHPACVFGGVQLPCLLALLRNVETDEPQAVHRTALTPDGQKIHRKMLGPKAGAVIELWPRTAVTDRLVVGEGIETTLSAALHIKHRGSPLQPAWSCVDAGNLAALPVLPGVQQLVILVDHDESNTGQEKALECSRRWVSAGREVRRLTPHKPGDFNDIILKG
jgi:phage/plasmid primase-like uncharacterized protein